MAQPKLVLTIPQGSLIAISLDIEGFARHRSPGSGKFFQGRTIFFEVGLKDMKPEFSFLDEGGWRDAPADTAYALSQAAGGRRTKTALSNAAFNCTPIDAYRRCFLGRTGGQILEMESDGKVFNFPSHECNENMSSDQVSTAIGQFAPAKRIPHLYLVFEPIQFVVMSSLTPLEYAWYASHRPGKIFRQMLFTELKEVDRRSLAAESIFSDAQEYLISHPGKKTKTIFIGDCLNAVPFSSWVGYDRKEEGGIYVSDRNKLSLWRFPEKIPASWERAEG